MTASRNGAPIRLEGIFYIHLYAITSGLESKFIYLVERSSGHRVVSSRIPGSESRAIEEGVAMEHACSLAKRMRRLVLDEDSSDMAFIVQGEYLPAHRAIFIASSDYFW